MRARTWLHANWYSIVAIWRINNSSNCSRDVTTRNFYGWKSAFISCTFIRINMMRRFLCIQSYRIVIFIALTAVQQFSLHKLWFYDTRSYFSENTHHIFIFVLHPHRSSTGVHQCIDIKKNVHCTLEHNVRVNECNQSTEHFMMMVVCCVRRNIYKIVHCKSGDIVCYRIELFGKSHRLMVPPWRHILTQSIT